jgi:hypothetical protein
MGKITLIADEIVTLSVTQLQFEAINAYLRTGEWPKGKARIVTTSLNIRLLPAASSRKVGSLAKGKMLNFYRYFEDTYHNVWVKIVDPVEGWICAEQKGVGIYAATTFNQEP